MTLILIIQNKKFLNGTYIKIIKNVNNLILNKKLIKSNKTACI